eukprot:CAMPEP_0176432444 /NCGR_PEP_ID=MMETSP0127-20121128/15400_1 /TAXON_ID=938130 /ORGANISM="Platyophrya macrostoma, Strain WH" /LENGTH=144 /DNA_ID=CAMNT_0017814621 /DNA_START=16 /DNA_END=450 /DNA_ORIENTATION=+
MHTAQGEKSNIQQKGEAIHKKKVRDKAISQEFISRPYEDREYGVKGPRIHSVGHFGDIEVAEPTWNEAERLTEKAKQVDENQIDYEKTEVAEDSFEYIEEVEAKVKHAASDLQYNAVEDEREDPILIKEDAKELNELPPDVITE